MFPHYPTLFSPSSLVVVARVGLVSLATSPAATLRLATLVETVGGWGGGVYGEGGAR